MTAAAGLTTLTPGDGRETVAPEATPPRPPDPDLASYSLTRLRREVTRRKAIKRAATLTPSRETEECIAGVRRQIRALTKRVGSLDIDQLTELRALTDEMSAATAEAAWLLHDNPSGYSWGEIAAALGITKPTCWRQYGQRRTEGSS